MNKKIGIVEVSRFASILFIMSPHLYLLGYSGDYIFRSCWAWTDYFFMLTGYFTARHYKIPSTEVYDNCSHEAMRYTLKKYKAFMPYVFLAVIMQYLITAFPLLVTGSYKEFVFSFKEMPYEILLLSSSGMASAKLAPIWYLSATFIVLPVVIYFMLKLKDSWYILSWLLPILYYGKMGVNTSRAWPNDMVRAMACLILGTFIYLLAEKLKGYKICRALQVGLTILEVTSWGAIVYITVYNKNLLNLLLVLFVLNIAIMFSGHSYTTRVNGRWCSVLGSLSLPMFLFHWAIGSLVAGTGMEQKLKLVVYYGGTIILSAVGVLIKEAIVRKYYQGRQRF